MPTWKVTTEFTFNAAHLIRDYDGPCGRLHGHTYTVRVEASANRLYPSAYCPHSVMVADFRTLRWPKRDLLQGGLDHSVLNEVLPAGYETTAEMIAKYIYDKTQQQVPEGVRLKVAVSETPNSWVEYEDGPSTQN
ncbi:MAG: 6-carboxytetrahydropterin synthase [Leptolyngbyaceae bacterium]|nr:6-carboxytetrahydropterin synthase [Leptolyngbyaceae bacterium]